MQLNKQLKGADFASASFLVKIQNRAKFAAVKAVTALVRKARCLKFRISMFIRKLHDVHGFSL